MEYKFQDQENSEDIFSFENALEDFICIVFVLDRNIVKISVGLILNGLTNDFDGSVRNYNTHNMGKTIDELPALLIKYENGLPKKAATPQVLAIQGGRIRKPNKKLKDDKGNGKCKGKSKLDYGPKPKNPSLAKKEHLTKDVTSHH
ncbi:hypothetical protein Tco_1392715 [Tanacetum coccineum]